MKAIVSVYKSEIVEYMKENNLKDDEVIMICSNAEFLKAEADKKATDVVLLSAPMGVPMNYDFLRFALIDAETKPMPINEVVLDTPDDPNPKTGGGDMEHPMIGGDNPSNEEEVKEILEAPPEADSAENVGSLEDALKEAAVSPTVVEEPPVEIPKVKKPAPKKKKATPKKK